MKRLFACLLSLVLCLSLVPAALAAKSFSDVSPKHWAYSYVSTAVQKGWVNGMTATQYQPEGTVTGAQFLTMVTRAVYPGDIPAGTSGAWYQPYVIAADRHGLREGAFLETDEDFNTGLSRYQMAQVLDNLLADTGRRPTEYFNAAASIGDWDVIPSFYEQAVAETYALGLLTGMDARGSFEGYLTMTRAQAAAVLCRLGEAVPVQPPAGPAAPVSGPGAVSDQGLLDLANARLEDQFRFLAELWTGAAFAWSWEPAFTTPLPDGGVETWKLVIAPGMNSLADIRQVWYTYFARAWAFSPDDIPNYMERNGRLYTNVEGIGDDVSFRGIQAERVLSRSGTSATLQVTAYHDNWDGTYEMERYRYLMIWEDGQWKCSALYLDD